MVEEAMPKEKEDYLHKARLLQTYYERLNEIDENNRDLTSFFFAVNTATFAVVMQLLKEDWQRLILAIVGYFASAALALIGYKSFWSWRTYAKEMRRLEDELGYGIAAKYEEQLNKSPAKSVRVTNVRLRFNFLFLILWALLIPYLVFTIPAPWSINPLLAAFLGGIIVVLIICLPWAYLLSSLKLAVLKAVLCAPWAREV